MPIKLNRATKSHMITSIAEELPNFEVLYRLVVRQPPDSNLRNLDNVLKKNSAEAERLTNILGENPISKFTFEEIRRLIRDNYEMDLDEATAVRLTEFEEFTDSYQSAKSLTEKIESLPWKYAFIAKLPKSLGVLIPNDETEFRVSDNISIVRATPEVCEAFPDDTNGENETDDAVNRKSERRKWVWSDETIYLKVEGDGYVGVYDETVIIQEIVERLKAFCGLGLAVGIFLNPNGFGSGTELERIRIYQAKESNWKHIRSYSLDHEFSRVLRTLRMNDYFENVESNPELRIEMNGLLLGISGVFENTPKTEYLLTGAQWFLEGMSATNKMLSFVQTMVVLEIILGDKSASARLGLGELLGNRCAYLIGSTLTERDEILGEFKEIYKVRSEIVHSGKTRLSQREKRLFEKLQGLCRRVIETEMASVTREKES